MDKVITETLEIHNFFSINHIKWEIGRFNIITGDMGAGKSLCIKLLKFFEDIIPGLLVLPYDNFYKNLDTEQCFEYIKKDFIDIFDFQSSNKQQQFTVDYSFSYKEENFSMSIMRNDDGNINFKSTSLIELIKIWQEHLQKKENITPDGFEETKRFFYSALLKKFGEYFPIATTFIPASRAALAFSSNYKDYHLKEFKDLIDVLPRFKGRNQEIINTILKAKIKIEDGFLYFESDDGRKVPISKASSGQQEIVYLLMLLDKIGYFHYTYGKYHSLFIEEPEAQLFPMKQRQIIEFIIQIYNLLKENGNSLRCFITTHSPYILNSINNILKKGALLEKYKGKEEKINNTVDIPHLYANEVSAYFLDGEGGWENMLDMDEKYLYADKITEISNTIDNIAVELSNLNNILLSEEE